MKRICHSLFFLTFSIIFVNVSAQVNMKGKIIDTETGIPISFANIVLSPQFEKSTISNLNGEFNIADTSLPDSIIISCIGYKTQKISRQSLTNNMLISLLPKIYQLPEVVISNINAQKLMTEAYTKISMNYPIKYPTLFGTYRKQVVEDGKYVFFGECRLNTFSPSFNEKQTKYPTEITVSNVRISENKITDENSLNLMCSSVLVPYPIFYYFREPYINDFMWSFDGTVQLNDGEYAYKINFKGKHLNDDPQNENNKGVVYISESDKAIIKLYREQQMNDINTRGGGSFT